MFKSLTKTIIKRPKTVLTLMLVFMMVAGSIGGGVAKKLTSGGFEDSKSDSFQAVKRIDDKFGRKSSNVLLLVTFKNGTADDMQNAQETATIEQRLRSTQHMSGVFSYYSAGKVATLKSTNNKQVMVLGSLEGSQNEIAGRIKQISPEFSYNNKSVTVGVGGFAEINNQFNKQIEDDLKIAELIALPITLLILVLVFRSVIAASLPIIIGLFSISGSLLVLLILTKFTDVSIYALNLTTMLGLGLAIDYSLFIVARFREHLAKGEHVDIAVQHAVEKAGRTVMFSALTVAVSLLALLVFPQTFLKSFAFAGVAVSLVSALGSIILLPAILKLLGRNVNKWHIGPAVDYTKGSKFWHKTALFVMKRPVQVAAAATMLLLILGAPFLSINLGRGDERSLPKDNSSRIVHDDIRRNFNSRETSGLDIVSTTDKNVTVNTIEAYAKTLSLIAGADHVESAAGVFANGQKVSPIAAPNTFKQNVGTWLSVIPKVEPFSKDGEKLTKEVRTAVAPFPVLVGGQSASLVDLKESIFKNLPIAFAIIAITTFILLFMMFGGVLVPIKALVINVLSLSAVFGIITWIFQDGHFSGILGFTPTGMIEATMPILMFCIAFGLSMDYEVFLLSRIKEHFDHTGDNRQSVAYGLEKTGGIVTAAAVSISVVFIAFATSGVTTIKLFGFGLAVAVLLDAFIIRGTLVPAFMRLAGDANWWAPKPLKKLYDRYGIKD